MAQKQEWTSLDLYMQVPSSCMRPDLHSGIFHADMHSREKKIVMVGPFAQVEAKAACLSLLLQAIYSVA